MMHSTLYQKTCDSDMDSVREVMTQTQNTAPVPRHAKLCFHENMHNGMHEFHFRGVDDFVKMYAIITNDFSKSLFKETSICWDRVRRGWQGKVARTHTRKHRKAQYYTIVYRIQSFTKEVGQEIKTTIYLIHRQAYRFLHQLFSFFFH